MSDESLLTRSAKMLTAKGYEQVDSHHDEIDEAGINYTVFERDDETYLVRAKEYVYEQLAPFGADMVDHALEIDAMLVIYFRDRNRHYVFDPAYLDAEGERQTGRSKRSDRREWLEVTLDHGTDLHAYSHGDGKPDTLATIDDRATDHDRSLTDYL